MTKKQTTDQNKADPVQLEEEQLDSISGGPTAVENLMLNFTKSSALDTSKTTIGTKTITSSP